MRNFSFSIKLNSVLSSSHFWICWLFWKSWPTKLISLADNEELKIVLSSVLIYLLYIDCEATDEDKDGRDEKYFSHFIKILWKINFSQFLFLNQRKQELFPRNVWWYHNLFFQELCKLVYLFGHCFCRHYKR